MTTRLAAHRETFDRLLTGQYAPPVTCEVDISGRCQNDCSWCYFKGRLGDGLMEEKTFDVLLKRLKDVGARSLTFTGGGEPLTHPGFSRFAWKARTQLKLGLITNGVMLDRYRYELPLLEFVRVSLDAATPQTYQAIKGRNYFQKVIENIASSAKVVRTGVSFVVCEENEHEVEAAQDLVKTLGAAYLQFKPNNLAVTALSMDHGSRVTNRFMPIGDAPCKLAASVGVVTPNGDAYYCCQKRGLPDYKLGNILEDDFEAMWTRRGDVKPHDCDACRYMNYLKDDDTFPENVDFL